MCMCVPQWCPSKCSGLSSQLGPEDYRKHAYSYMPEEVDIDVSSLMQDMMLLLTTHKGSQTFIFSPHQTKLSRLCEQDKMLRTQEEKLQQMYREKVGKLH